MLWENYNLADVGHPGQSRMLKLIKQNYWWPEIKEDVKKYFKDVQMPTEQSTTSKENGRITPIGNTIRILVGNQYWYYWSITKFKWNRCYCGYHG